MLGDDAEQPLAGLQPLLHVLLQALAQHVLLGGVAEEVNVPCGALPVGEFRGIVVDPDQLAPIRLHPVVHVEGGLPALPGPVKGV